MMYHLAAVGGTFDHFHAGHHQLLRTAASVATKLVIGITHPSLTQTKTDAQLIEAYNSRHAAVADWINDQHLTATTQLVELTDPFGPTLTNPQIDALVVSEMTQAGAVSLNQARTKQGLPPLPVTVASMVLDQAGDYISSTNIRRGLITRNGWLYRDLFNQDIVFSADQLELLKEPQGSFFNPQALAQASSVHLVGDMVTQYFLDHKLPFHTAIIDGKTKRQPIQLSITPQHQIADVNKAGTINAKVAKQLINLITSSSSQTIIQINGEEDLLAFVSCLNSPLNSLVIYGQPDVGLVMIHLTEAHKLRLGRIIDPSLK